MSKRFFKGNNASPAKKFKLDVTRESILSKEKTPQQNVNTKIEENNFNDLWGDEFGEEEIEEMDFIASQATQEEAVFVAPKARPDSMASTSSGISKTNSQKYVKSKNIEILQSQMLASSEIDKEIIESTQAIMFDDFENNMKSNSLNSTFRNRQDTPSNNVILITDDNEVEKWKEEKKKLLEDFMTKEGETEFLRQQLNQIQARAENVKKEQARLIEEQTQNFRAEISELKKKNSSLETQLQIQTLNLNKANDKCKILESGSVKFAQPEASINKSYKDKSNASMIWTPKKSKTKEISIQVEETLSAEHLKTSVIRYPLKIIPQSAFEPSEPEKSVVEIKIEEKIGKRNLAIIQEEETFRIFENPELSKPKITVIDGENLNTEFILPDIAKLINKTDVEINSPETIPILNKLIATARELLLNSTLVLNQISEALQNDDIRDMNELYLSEFYDMPVPHTKSSCEARAWYDLERGIEARRAIGLLSYIATTSNYLSDYVAGNIKLRTNKDLEYERYAKQMKSYEGWYKKGFDFEFLELILDFIEVVKTIRRSHQFIGLINSIMTLIINVQANIGFSQPGSKRVLSIFKAIIHSRPLLASFIPMSNLLNEFSHVTNFVSKLCICPEKSGINYWKGSLNFAPDACALQIFITQLDNFKLDPITLIKITKDLVVFSNIALLNNSIPWLEKTINSCNCCLNLLKFVIINLFECSKIDIEQLKNKYTENNILGKFTALEINSKKNKTFQKTKYSEDWKNFGNNYKENFWNELRTHQSLAIAHGIRLLSFLAKRDLDFMIRLTYIEDAFHLFLDNLDNRKDFKLKKSDEIALDIVKKAFVLEKTKEENKSSQKSNIIDYEKEDWIDFNATSADLIKLYDT